MHAMRTNHGVFLSVNQSVCHALRCAKTSEPIDFLLGVETLGVKGALYYIYASPDLHQRFDAAFGKFLSPLVPISQQIGDKKGLTEMTSLVQDVGRLNQ